MPIELRPHRDGDLVELRVQPGSKRDRVVGVVAGRLKIAVAAPPAEGRANEAVIEFLRDLWSLRRSQVELVGGATSRNKTVLLRDLSPADRDRIAGADFTS